MSIVTNHPISVVIIGAGLAGLSAARLLTQSGFRVVVLEKGRGVGGRMATRRLQDAYFDHGAQYFSARTSAFQEQVLAAERDGFVKRFRPGNIEDGHDRWMGMHGMTALPKYLSRTVQIFLEERVVRVQLNPNGWKVTTSSDKVFQAGVLIFTIPAPQVLELFHFSGLSPGSHETALHAISYDPCFALLLKLNTPCNIPFPGTLQPEEGPLAWIADNQQKGISPLPALTVHATPAYSKLHLEEDPAEVGKSLLPVVEKYTGPLSVLDMNVHRWRYSLARQRHPAPFLVEGTDFPVYFGGDGFGEIAHVEGAFVSGEAIARHLIEQMSERSQ